jgi:hypothetical protein
MTSSGRFIINVELEMMQKDAVVAYFNARSQNYINVQTMGILRPKI